MRWLRPIGIAILPCVAACSIPTTRESPPPAVKPSPARQAPSLGSESAIVHVVEEGQTLWRIARTYGVNLAWLAEVNGIEDPASVAVGAVIRIPGVSVPRAVPPYPQPVPKLPGDEVFPPSDDARNLLWPVAGGEVLSPFGAERRTHRHAGVDIRGYRGQEILAARGGRVVFSGTQRGYGKVVILDHGDGMQTVYAHADTLGVAEGDRVNRGQAIATVGRTGNATSDHLHFEVRLRGSAVDPSLHFRSVAEVKR